MTDQARRSVRTFDQPRATETAEELALLARGPTAYHRIMPAEPEYSLPTSAGGRANDAALAPLERGERLRRIQSRIHARIGGPITSEQVTADVRRVVKGK